MLSYYWHSTVTLQPRTITTGKTYCVVSAPFTTLVDSVISWAVPLGDGLTEGTAQGVTLPAEKTEKVQRNPCV